MSEVAHCGQVILYLTPFVPFRVNLQGEPLSFKGEGEIKKRGAKPLFDTLPG